MEPFDARGSQKGAKGNRMRPMPSLFHFKLKPGSTACVADFLAEAMLSKCFYISKRSLLGSTDETSATPKTASALRGVHSGRAIFNSDGINAG